MRRVLAAAAALLMCAGPALAQNTWNHAGMYAGLTAGYSTAQLETPGIDLAATGAQGGVFVGYGVVANGGLYLGVEADAVMRDIKWKIAEGGSSASASNAWSGSLRLRVGQELGPMLLYVTGGAAVTDQKIEVAGLGSESELRWGFVGGAGIEARITKTVALRLEGLHYVTPDKTFWLGGDSAKIGTGETVARVGISFKLN